MEESVLENIEQEVIPETPVGKSQISVTRHKADRFLYFGRTVAINISDKYLDLATAHNFGLNSRLRDITRIDIPTDEPDKKSIEHFLITQITEYLKIHANRFTRIVVGLHGNNTAFRIISLPDMSAKELANAVYWEAKKRIPFGINQAQYGFHKLETVQSGDQKTTSLALLAISKLEVEEQIGAMKPIEDKISALNSDIEAIGYLLPYLPDYDKNKSYALINIQKEFTEISFYRGSRLEFMHLSSIGYKGINIDNIADPKYQPFIDALVNEIQNSLDFYVGQFSVDTADQVYIYGDLSYAADLLVTLTERFGVEFKCYPLTKFIKANPTARKFVEMIPPCLGVAALALANFKLIDFLPDKLQEAINIKRLYRLAIPAISVALIVMIGLSFLLNHNKNILAEKIALADEQIAHIQSSPSFIMYNKIKNQMAAEQAILNHLNNKPTHLYLTLKELSRLTPRRVELNQYELKNIGGHNHLTMMGQVVSNNPPPEIILAEFVAQLENSPFYDKIIVKKHIKKTEGSNFKIEFQINADAIL